MQQGEPVKQQESVNQQGAVSKEEAVKKKQGFVIMDRLISIVDFVRMLSTRRDVVESIRVIIVAVPIQVGLVMSQC